MTVNIVWGLVAVAWGLLVLFIDATTRRIPNYLSLPAIAVTWGACVVVALGWMDHVWIIESPWAVLGGVAWYLLIVALSAWFPRMQAGAGDAKLAASLGVIAVAAHGVLGLLWTVSTAGVLGALWGVWWRRKEEIPQGPAMIIATAFVAVCMWAGRAL